MNTKVKYGVCSEEEANYYLVKRSSNTVVALPDKPNRSFQKMLGREVLSILVNKDKQEGVFYSFSLIHPVFLKLNLYTGGEFKIIYRSTSLQGIISVAKDLLELINSPDLWSVSNKAIAMSMYGPNCVDLFYSLLEENGILLHRENARLCRVEGVEGLIGTFYFNSFVESGNAYVEDFSGRVRKVRASNIVFLNWNT